MGLSSREHDHAWYRDVPGRKPDRGQAAAGIRRVAKGRRFSGGLIAAFALVLTAGQVLSDPLRIATLNTELQRDGPGLLLRDILRGEDPQVQAVVEVLVETAPDIAVLQGFDYDLTAQALSAFTNALSAKNIDFPYVYSGRPNTGMVTGMDMDGNGRTGEPRDAQGYGRFSGQGGMAVLSRFPILQDGVREFTDLLWRDFPDALLPTADDAPFPSEEAQAMQRLSTTAHWVVPVDVPEFGRVDLLTFHASPPVFDGPEDRNGRRNHDEITFWLKYLDGAFGPVPDVPFVLLGDFNQDPDEGEGIKSAIRSILADTRLIDPAPQSEGSLVTSGDPFDTADWDDPMPGNMRVDYVLPSSHWRVVGSGVYWPTGKAGETVRKASRHRLVWVDLTR